MVINIYAGLLVAASGKRFDHDYIVMSVEGGGFLMVQIHSNGVIDTSFQPDMGACHAEAVRAVGTGDRGEPFTNGKRTYTDTRTVGAAVSRVASITPRYKLVGEGAFNCQHLSQILLDW